MTSLYSHDIIVVLIQWIIIKQGYKKKYLVNGDCSQSTWHLTPAVVKQRSRERKQIILRACVHVCVYACV